MANDPVWLVQGGYTFIELTLEIIRVCVLGVPIWICAPFFVFVNLFLEENKMIKRILGVMLLILPLICALTSCGHDHEWCDWQIAKEATCAQNGINTRVCDDCGEIQSITIYAKGHSWSEWDTILEATCTDDGSKERSCYCGEKETQTIHSRGYHSFSDWNEIQIATCLTESIKEKVCDCGETKTEVTPGYAKHNYVSGICSVCKKEANSIVLANIQSRVTLPDVPLELSNSAARAKLTSLIWTMDSSNIYITFSGEKTWSYFGGSHYLDFVFKIYDSEGYLIDNFQNTVSDLSVGDKFKGVNITIPLSLFESNEDYTVKIIIHC